MKPYRSLIDRNQVGFEDETYSMLSGMITSGVEANGSKRVRDMIDVMDGIYIVCFFKIQKDLPEDYEAKLLQLRNEYYSAAKDKYFETQLYIRARELWKQMCFAVGKAGLSFRINRDNATKAFVKG